MANPRFVVLSADVDTPITLDSNYSRVEVALISGAANTWFNTLGAVVPAVAGPMDGNHILTTLLPAKVVLDGTGGANSVVHIRSVGTPTVSVLGI